MRPEAQAGGEGAPSRTAVLLLNMGGPDSLAAIRPFLENLFRDPAILGVPGWLRRPLAWWIAARRSRRVAANYRAIGGKSPLREITEAQAAALERELGAGPGQWSVHVGMRYWHPFTREAAQEMRAAAPDRIVLLPLYPQYSRATSGSSLDDAERALAAAGLADVPRTVIRSWAEHPAYLDALAASVGEGLAQAPSGATLLFSAHGLPVRLIEAGDPYLEHVRATVAGVVARLPEVPHRLAFQSRTGPVEWLQPYTDDAIRELAAGGAQDLLVVPVSFVSDHVETLHEIDLEYGELARSLGIRSFRRVPSLNTRPDFIRALAELVRQEVDGSGSR